MKSPRYFDWSDRQAGQLLADRFCEILFYVRQYGMGLRKFTLTQLKKSKKNRSIFAKNVHSGYRIAQRMIVEDLIDLGNAENWLNGAISNAFDLQTKTRLRKARVSILNGQGIIRKLADSLAWILVNHESYIVRRFFIGERAQPAQASTLRPMLAAAEEINDADPEAFALISDATSCIQVGDLLVIHPLSGTLTPVELKSGKVNTAGLHALEKLQRGESSLEEIEKEFGGKVLKQIKRMQRQVNRAAFIQEITETGTGINPDTQTPVSIPKERPDVDVYIDELLDIFAELHQKPWAIRVVDGFLYIGGYNRQIEHMPLAFPAWMQVQENPHPIHDLFEGLFAPLAYPCFLRLPPDDVHAFVARDKMIFMSVDWDKGSRILSTLGVKMGFLSRKESARAKRPPEGSLIEHDHRLLFLEQPDGSRGFIGTGILFRILFEFYRPISAISTLITRHN